MKTYKINHLIDNEKVTYLNGGTELIDFTMRVIAENGDKDIFTDMNENACINYLWAFCEETLKVTEIK